MSPKAELVDSLLDFPDGPCYRKWTGTHWRLVQIADAGRPVDRDRLAAGVEAELAWLLSGLAPPKVLWVAGLARRHGSIEGNAVYALARLGYAEDPRTLQLVEALLDWQWPDGGWNCDRHPDAHRSSFHESAIPALGLSLFAAATGHQQARHAAERTAELLLEHRLFRASSTGRPIHHSWPVLHYPAYWHYDVLQGLRLLEALDRLDDPRAQDALDVVESARRADGGFAGRSWTSSSQPAAVDWGHGTGNIMLNEIATSMLVAAGRASPP